MTETLGLYMWKESFSFYHIGYGDLARSYEIVGQDAFNKGAAHFASPDKADLFPFQHFLPPVFALLRAVSTLLQFTNFYNIINLYLYKMHDI